MLYRLTSSITVFSRAERLALAQLAQRLWDRRGEIAADWVARMATALPDLFTDPELHKQAEAIGRTFLTVSLDKLLQGDVQGLAEAFYGMNRRMIEADFSGVFGRRLELPDLYVSAQAALSAIEDRLIDCPVPLLFAHTHLSNHLILLIGLADSDARADELRRAHADLEGVVQQRTSELAKEKAVGDTIIATLPGIFYLFDSNGRFLRWNKNFEQVSQRDASEIAALHPLDFFRGADRDLIAERITEVFQRGQSTAEASFVARDGSSRPFFFSGHRVAVDDRLCVIGMGLDISERKRAEDELRRARTAQMFAALLESAPDAMVVTDRHGAIILVNSETERLFGYTRQQMIGQPITSLISEDVGAQRTAIMIEAAGHHRDGARFPIEIKMSPLETEDGRLVTTAIRDITQRKQAEDEIRSLNTTLERRVAERTAELARSNSELEQFAYIASHDLQEPLRAVASYTQMFAERYRDLVDEEGRSFLDRTTGAVGRMQELIRDLLAYSRIGMRRAPLAMTDCNRLVQDVLEDLGTAIQDSAATVTVDRLPKVPADRSQLRQLFQNLIGNALKFRGTDPPQVRISVEEVRAEEGDGGWVFHVRDNGIGIPPQYRDRVFAIFKRLHNRRAYPGTGVGLAICKKIVERHGGSIWIEANGEQGTQVSFRLPATAHADEASAQPAAP